MKVLVTGGAGFIGSRFVNLIFSPKYYESFEKVLVFDSLTYAGNLDNLKGVFNDKKFEFQKIDICNKSLQRKGDLKVDVIINFAAESHVDRSIADDAAFIQTNIFGTHNLLKSALANNCQKFIQISTDEVYGSIKSGSWSEDSKLDPSSSYSASKASADLLVMSYYKTYGLNINITRSCNNYGPNQNYEKLIPMIIQNAIQNLPIPIYGSGENIREWIHVDDNCEAILSVLLQGKSGEIYNIGSGVELSNLDLANLILKKLNRSDNLIRFVPDRLGHDFRYSISAIKAKSELDFSCRHSISNGLDELTRSYSSKLL